MYEGDNYKLVEAALILLGYEPNITHSQTYVRRWVLMKNDFQILDYKSVWLNKNGKFEMGMDPAQYSPETIIEQVLKRMEENDDQTV